MKTDMPIVQQNQITVTGVVKDANGEPITGAAVVVKGTTNGTITDIDGKYSLSVPEGSTLSFSFVGFKTQEVRANKTTLNVVMQEEAIGLDEVVAIGYGYVKKRDLTGAVSSVSADDMVIGGTVSNAAQALQGKTAGVQVQQTSKAPGGSISVRFEHQPERHRIHADLEGCLGNGHLRSAWCERRRVDYDQAR